MASKNYKYSNREYTEMVRIYAKTGDNASETRRIWAERFPDTQVPSTQTICAATQRLYDYGAFKTPKETVTVAKPRVERLEKKIIEYFKDNPRSSVREAASFLDVSTHRVSIALKNENFKPFHMHSVEKQVYNNKRANFCQWLLENLEQNILWTDSDKIIVGHSFNARNSHWWSKSNPHKTIRDYKQNHPEQITVNVWAGIINKYLLGPLFIDGPLTGPKYLKMLQTSIQIEIDNLPLNVVSQLYYQHDGAPEHNEAKVRKFMEEKYGENWIGRGGPVHWPAKSTDLTPVRFFLWPEVKKLVFAKGVKIETEEQLKKRIVQAFDNIRERESELVCLINLIEKRAKMCIEADGGEVKVKKCKC